ESPGSGFNSHIEDHKSTTNHESRIAEINNGRLRMPLTIRLKLSTLMFLQYFVWGAWSVTLGTWLGQTLGFSGEQIGLGARTTRRAPLLLAVFVRMIGAR